MGKVNVWDIVGPGLIEQLNDSGKNNCKELTAKGLYEHVKNVETMNKIDQIKECIAKADRFESKLSKEALEVPSLASLKIRHLLNNLGSISNGYFEVGLHRAGTFVSTNYENNLRRSIGCDNWSEFNEGGETKQDFLNNCAKNGIDKYDLMDMDCFEINLLPDGIDLYLFDGNHSEESQCKAITHFVPMLAKECIICVDDASWPDVKNGTDRGLKESGVNVLFDVLLWDGNEGNNDQWWNGYRVILIQK